VDGERGPTVSSEILCNVIRNPLGGNENEHFGVLIADDVEMFDEFAALLGFGAYLDNLLDIVIRRKFRRSDV
jgi:hypothetical protein